MEVNLDKVVGEGTADKVEGKVKQVVGKGKEVVGEAIGDGELQAEGHAEQAEGKVQKAVGELKDIAVLVSNVVEEGAHVVVDAAKNLIHRNQD